MIVSPIAKDAATIVDESMSPTMIRMLCVRRRGMLRSESLMRKRLRIAMIPIAMIRINNVADKPAAIFSIGSPKSVSIFELEPLRQKRDNTWEVSLWRLQRQVAATPIAGSHLRAHSP